MADSFSESQGEIYKSLGEAIDKFKYALNSKKYFKKNQEEYKFIMTSFMPLYSMLGGYFIKRKYKKRKPNGFRLLYVLL